MTIPRSTQAIRVPFAGELRGAAPVPHQVRRITVEVEQLPDGRWRLTQPRVPGWAAAARNPGEVAAALRRGFTEAQIAAHSDWRNTAYDAVIPTYRRDQSRRPGRNAPNRYRRDVHDPRAWQQCSDGRWLSPKGHLYPEDTQVVQRVMAARSRLGLPARPDPVSPSGEVQSMVAAAAQPMIVGGATA